MQSQTICGVSTEPAFYVLISDPSSICLSSLTAVGKLSFISTLIPSPRHSEEGGGCDGCDGRRPFLPDVAG